MPESFFILSKENLELAIDEIASIVKSHDRFAKFHTISNIVLVQSTLTWDKIAIRSTFVKVSGQVLRRLSNLFLDEKNYKILMSSKTFCCRVINIANEDVDVSELEKIMGNMVSKFFKAKVDLRNPDITIYLIFGHSERFFGFSTKIKTQASLTKVFRHSHELERKLARVMINLAGLKEGETLCDPFCGTGTILLEAESMGIRSIGIDFDNKMCQMAQKNIRANGFNSDVINADYHYLNRINEGFDVIVTDVPYGKNSKTVDSPELTFKKFLKTIPKRKKFVIMCKKEIAKKVNPVVSKKYEIYRHKSLTRVILVK